MFRILDMDGDDDDWLITSLTKYEQLFMYELSTPMHLIKLSNDHKKLWCYGRNTRNKRELLILNLPNKLTNNETLTSSRDFKISGGAIVPFEISCIEEVSDQHIVVASDINNVHWWTQNNDLLVEKSSQNIPDTKSSITMIESVTSNKHQLTLGSSSDGDIKLYDTISQCVLWKHILNTKLHGIHYYQPYQLVTCSNNDGNISIVDVRIPLLYQDLAAATNNQLVNISLCVSNTSIGTLSNTGQLKLYDVRSLPSPIYSVSMATNGIASIPILTMSPNECNIIGVSGINDGIHIYDTKTSPPTNNFIHDGHKDIVLNHLWNPLISRLLLSVASDGTLHAWQYNTCK